MVTLVESNGRDVKDTGLYQSGKWMVKGGRSMLFCIICISFMFLLIFSIIITSEVLDVNGTSVYNVKTTYVLFLSLALIICIALFLLLCVPTLYYGKKSKTRDFSEGTLMGVLVSDIDSRTGAKYVAFIGSDRKCSDCGANLVSKDAKFCSDCGHKQS